MKQKAQSINPHEQKMKLWMDLHLAIHARDGELAERLAHLARHIGWENHNTRMLLGPVGVRTWR